MTADTEKYSDDEMMASAAEALAVSDQVASEELYNVIVKRVQAAFNNNQRDVASELQRLSKLVETARSNEDALTFKQRTCESMLKISMAERHKGRTAPQQAPPPVQSGPPFRSLDYLYVGAKNFDDDVRFYKDVLKAELLWAFNRGGKKIAAFKMVYGPVVLLTDHLKAPAVEPLFGVESLGSAMERLKAAGVKKIEGPIQTLCGDCCRFEDPSGNKINLVQSQPMSDALEKAYADPANKDAIRFA